PPLPPIAFASLKNAEGGDVGGVLMWRGPQGLVLRIEAAALPQGWHATHLHAVGSCETPAFTSAGGHVNHAPAPRPHGLLNPEGPDSGDLQNVYVASDGEVRAELYLAGGGEALLDGDGLAFVMHAGPDDHHSQPIGGAGARIACGVFQRAG
ncbi:MAG TPA: superoxide dismutase family protein, partial [Caulobacteraceae bacterium]